eukprot:3233716-Prymnesium_polylepis.1
MPWGAQQALVQSLQPGPLAVPNSTQNNSKISRTMYEDLADAVAHFNVSALMNYTSISTAPQSVDHRILCLVQYDDRSDDELGQERDLMRLNQKRCQDAKPYFSGGFHWSCVYVLDRDPNQQATISSQMYDSVQRLSVAIEQHWAKVFVVHSIINRPGCDAAVYLDSGV